MNEGLPRPPMATSRGCKASAPGFSVKLNQLSCGVRRRFHTGWSDGPSNSSRQVKLPVNGTVSGDAGEPVVSFGPATTAGTGKPGWRITGQPSSVHLTGNKNVSLPVL